MKLQRLSILTDKINAMELPITLDQYKAYRMGDTPAQILFPDMPEAELHFLLTGITPEEDAALRLEMIAENEYDDMAAECELSYA